MQYFDSALQQVVLYGSVAKNEATPESNIAVILTNVLTIENRNEFLTLVAELDTKFLKSVFTDGNDRGGYNEQI